MVWTMKKYPYSVATAASYATVLLLTLWWLPILGPIITGYITGRKAGGPIKGLVAMSMPIFLYFLFIYSVAQGWIHISTIFHTEFIGGVIASLRPLPFFSFLNYVDATLKVAINVGNYFQHYLYYAPPSFFIMFSFAFIGGAVSRMVILEHGIFPERRKLFVRKKEKVTQEDIPQSQMPFHARVMLAHPVEYPGRVKPFVIPEEDENEEDKKVDMVENEEEDEKEISLESLKSPKTAKKRKKKILAKSKERRVKKFEDEENSKFVIHPVEEPKPVIIKGKKINRKHSLTFL